MAVRIFDVHVGHVSKKKDNVNLLIRSNFPIFIVNESVSQYEGNYIGCFKMNTKNSVAYPWQQKT